MHQITLYRNIFYYFVENILTFVVFSNLLYSYKTTETIIMTCILCTWFKTTQSFWTRPRMTNQVFLGWQSSSVCVCVWRFFTVLIGWRPHCDWSFSTDRHRGFISHAERFIGIGWFVPHRVPIWLDPCETHHLLFGENPIVQRWPLRYKYEWFKFIKTPILWRWRRITRFCTLNSHLPLKSSRTHVVHDGNQMARWLCTRRVLFRFNEQYYVSIKIVKFNISYKIISIKFYIIII